MVKVSVEVAPNVRVKFDANDKRALMFVHSLFGQKIISKVQAELKAEYPKKKRTLRIRVVRR